MQTFTPAEYVKLDIAGSFGLDKLTWQERLDWFDQNESQLPMLVTQAEEPALFYAGIKAWEDTKTGKPSGFMISLDATSSGLQLLACITGDSNAAKLCNVLPTGKREDAYRNIYDTMLSATGGKAEATHEETKQAIMTAFYGSTAMPRQIFGEGALLDMFYSVMQASAPAAWELNKIFLAMWNPDADKYSWTLPDNFHVESKVMDGVRSNVQFDGKTYEVFFKENKPTKTGRSIGANVVHSIDGFIVREMNRRCNYSQDTFNAVLDAIENPKNRPLLEDLHKTQMVMQLWDKYKKTGYLSARILDYLDDETINIVNTADILELLGSMPEKPFKVISIHDCFRVHPNYGNDLRAQYNKQLELIAKSNILSSIISELVGSTVEIEKMDPAMWEQISQADYALS